ncbi:DUF397 domain-containing protein [Streptomyces tibetensis]
MRIRSVSPGHPDVPVRDSKTAHGPALVFSRSGWAAGRLS